MSQIVLFAEVPAFYAAVERALEPTLTERPVVVGGDPRRRGVVQDASLDARAAGVEIGMPMQDALQRCPHARAIRTQMSRYREASLRLRACLRRAVERLEPEGLGAAYLDGSGLADTPGAVAGALRERVARELRFPLRVGIAPNKLLARLAAEEAGAGGVVEVRLGEEQRFLHALAVTRLPGVGRHTEARLAELGARTIGQLAALGRAALEAALGNRGLELLALARGKADSAIRAERYPGSLSQELTLEAPENDLVALGARLAELARRLETALGTQGLASRRIALKLRYADGETISRSQTLAHGVAEAEAIESLARGLLGRTEAGLRAVRLLGLSLASFSRSRREDRQLDLFPR